jgi:CHAD domain-containing protein
MAKAREIEGFAEASSFTEAAALAVETRTDELFSFGEGVLDTTDIERVHDMRVASRRLRAALEIFATCFPKAAHKRVLKDVKALADALGERRDRDVHIEELQRVSRAFAAPDRPGIGELIRALRAEQEAANVALAEELAAIEASELRTRLIALVEEARGA